MAKFYFISPIGKATPQLFDSFEETFIKEEHNIVGDVRDADVVFIDLYSHVSKNFPPEFQHCVETNVPLVYFDETDYGGMSKEELDFSLIDKIKNKFVYFMRKMGKHSIYPPYVYPYEKILMENRPLTMPEELFSRPYDFCWIGNESPERKNVVKGLLDAGLNGYVHWTNEKGKLSHDEWMKLHEKAKLFLESDGGGWGSERPMQLCTIVPMLRQRNDMLRVHDWKDCVSCIDVDEHPTKEDIENIKSILSGKEYLYEIYEKGAELLRIYYTAEARSLYIFNVLKKENII